MIEIKIWWTDPKIKPTTYTYADLVIAENHWEGFKKQDSVDHASMYQNNRFIRSYMKNLELRSPWSQ